VAAITVVFNLLLWLQNMNWNFQMKRKLGSKRKWQVMNPTFTTVAHMDKTQETNGVRRKPHWWGNCRKMSRQQPNTGYFHFDCFVTIF